MGFFKFIFLLSLLWSFYSLGSSQLQASQAQVLLQLKKHLEYPKQLESWYDHKTSFCYLQPSQSMNITCFSNSVTELNIYGDKSSEKTRRFEGFAVPNVTLSERFSIESFVTTLSRLKSLRVLTLASLGIWGHLPEKLHRLTSLEYLDLSNNFLFGSVPPKLAEMVKLETFRFDHNFFNGTLPSWFDSFANLKVLSFKSNELFGELHSSLLTLSTLEYIDLRANSLSGSLPGDLKCGSKLWFVDISDNKLTGNVPRCLSGKQVRVNGNCLSLEKQQHPVSFCVKEVRAEEHAEAEAEAEAANRPGEGGWKKGALVGLIIGVSMAALVLLCGVFILLRRKGVTKRHMSHKTVQDSRPSIGFSSEILSNARYISETAKIGTEDLPVCRQFTLEEIVQATKNFDKTAVLGESSLYGTLYKGTLENGTKVAIRCLPSSKKYSIRNLKLRLDLLAKLRHPNLVCLLGHCIDCGGKDDYSVEKVFLIYEYIPNGNFQSCLSDDSWGKSMNWSERLTVLTGVAKAVHYLHTGVIPGFFSNRLKTNNVLLNQHRFAKLSDYGLSIVSEATRHNTEIAKSWQMSRLEDDVYSFGLILLQAIVGPSVSAREEAFLRDELASLESEEGRRRMVNPTVQATCRNGSLIRVITLMNKCVSPESLSRPSFEDILWNLQYASQLQSEDGEQY
ncbi:Leucine-rich repeat protein kinase family protein [Raphanus sativus]|uniref:Probable inactive leucine-rich repeat receptor-like protein kinase At3g03770 n=1 Tax=Raphanus sativus TaxID=3726 RepID=A0A6J0LC41_RAPSA|nr:probable inactive leucine-rich repeat receptor-like protein kinase At3g03770 [Raphanus sativus]KAJ4878556.1 Leucine-rich repeat protein kinase family protein [Raphanus sativus]